ncbi:MAG: GDSL-type esterase/lipase family protein, partial [Ginsengibacter sp.]
MTTKKYFFVLFLLAIICAHTACAQLRIVCIGNSITQGKIGLRADSSYEYSYRPWLWGKLVTNGIKVDMVGFHPYFFDEREGSPTMKFEVNGVAFDRDCEAYYGITSTDFLNGNVSAGWTGAPLPKFADRINDAGKGYTPDIALIHMGTNDSDSTAEQVVATRKNIGAIIQVLRNKNPSVVVFVARLITGWKKINEQVDALCQEWYTAQSPVVAVDLATGFINDPKVEGTMTYDHVHPNKKGQLFMMERWYKSILENLHDVEPPVMDRKPVIVHKKGNSATLSWNVANDNYGIKSYVISMNGKSLATIDHDNNSYTVKNLKQGLNYSFSIKAKDWSGNLSDAIITTI